MLWSDETLGGHVTSLRQVRIDGPVITDGRGSPLENADDGERGVVVVGDARDA